MRLRRPFRSLSLATDVDVLPLRTVVEQRDGYVVIRTPSNPSFYWGNFLAFDEPPSSGDAERWEAAFDAEFACEPLVRHRAFAWDRADGAAGAAREEFSPRNYDLDESYGLIASAEELQPHARANQQVLVRALDTSAGADEARWEEVVEIQVGNREPGHEEPGYRAFSQAQMVDRRAVYAVGRGAWFVAIDPESDRIAAACGVVVTDGRGRFQSVDTAPAYRRRGICSRLVVEAAQQSAARFAAERFVIVADAHYHALGLYESLGFKRLEHTFGVCLPPHKRLDAAS